ncbi:hypothetical protein BH18ACT12_BH18ACT12_14990 [soil metagenome]
MAVPAKQGIRPRQRAVLELLYAPGAGELREGDAAKQRRAEGLYGQPQLDCAFSAGRGAAFDCARISERSTPRRRWVGNTPTTLTPAVGRSPPGTVMLNVRRPPRRRWLRSTTPRASVPA